MTAWWHSKTLDELSMQEWEALCDGCALCCLNKVEDVDTGEVYFSRVACALLDIENSRCSDYAARQKRVTDCLNLRDIPREQFSWLPASCAYRLRAQGKQLPAWHYLVCGDRRQVRLCGRSVCHFALSAASGCATDDHLLLRLEDALGGRLSE